MITTDSKHSFSRSKNKLDRDFTSLKLGEKWGADISYIRVNGDWNYLTIIIDLSNRKVVGWCVSDDVTTESTVVKAWISERNNRSIIDGFIFHSDRGVQYASNKMINLFSFHRKVTQSMSLKGNY